MSDYKRVKTTSAVFVAIRLAHTDMVVFGSYSAPDGDQFGDPSKGRMFTSFGFENSDYPVIEAETTWDICAEEPYKRNNETHEYWLCLPIRDDI